jgi:hypothetical protein
MEVRGGLMKVGIQGTLATLLTIIIAFSSGLTHASSNEPNTVSLEDDEYLVLAAVIKEIHLPGNHRWFMLTDRTVTFSCESRIQTGFGLGDCSGMRTRAQTPTDVLKWVQSIIPSIPSALIRSFESRGGQNARIEKELPLQFKQVIWGPTCGRTIPKDLGSPDFIAYPSRAAFTAERDSALIYVGVVSWSNISQSFGEYVFLAKKGKEWIVKGRARLWQLGQ